jgi:protein-disulfide isomerase
MGDAEQAALSPSPSWRPLQPIFPRAPACLPRHRRRFMIPIEPRAAVGRALSEPFMFDRRQFMAASAAACVLAGGVLAAPRAFAQQARDVIPLPELLASPPAKDLWQGAADAPVTMVEYASLTCSHCAHFHSDVYPTLKSKYIDTGKVRFVLRDFPLDPLAAAGALLARCAGDDKREAVVDLLFHNQPKWLVEKPLGPLADLMKQAGFTQESFDACLKNQPLYDAVIGTREQAADKYGVNSTPTFFINGKLQRGALTVGELDKVLEPLLKK